MTNEQSVEKNSNKKLDYMVAKLNSPNVKA